MSQNTWNIIEERTKLKEKALQCKHKICQKKEQIQKSYSDKNKEVKQSARQDKRNYINMYAEEAEKAALRGDLNKVYKIPKVLCGKANQLPPVKSSSGKIITTEKRVVGEMARTL